MATRFWFRAGPATKPHRRPRTCGILGVALRGSRDDRQPGSGQAGRARARREPARASHTGSPGHAGRLRRDAGARARRHGRGCAAIDRLRGTSVALKTVLAADAGAGVQLKREFRVVRDLSHPNLAPVYELAWAEGLWFFVMERVEGTDFTTWARGPRRVEAPTELPMLSVAATLADTPSSSPTAPMFPARANVEASPPRRSTTELRAALLQLVHGVEALHDVGLRHGDLNPSNVLVPSDGRVVCRFRSYPAVGQVRGLRRHAAVHGAGAAGRHGRARRGRGRTGTPWASSSTSCSRALCRCRTAAASSSCSACARPGLRLRRTSSFPEHRTTSATCARSCSRRCRRSARGGKRCPGFRREGTGVRGATRRGGRRSWGGVASSNDWSRRSCVRAPASRRWRRCTVRPGSASRRWCAAFWVLSKAWTSPACSAATATSARASPTRRWTASSTRWRCG